MPKGETTKFKFRESPMGIGSMEQKQSTGMAGSGSRTGKPTPGGAPDGKAKPDGAGAMRSQNEDAGTDPARMDIGSTVPGSRHASKPL